MRGTRLLSMYSHHVIVVHPLCSSLVLLRLSPKPIPRANSCVQKQYCANLLSSWSDNLRSLWQTITSPSHFHLYLPAPQPVHLLTPCHLLHWQKYLNIVFLCLTIFHGVSILNPSPTTFQPFLPLGLLLHMILRTLFNCDNRQSDSNCIPTWLLK